MCELGLFFGCLAVVKKGLRLLLPLDLVLFLHVEGSETRELGVIQAILDVESHGHRVEHILAHGFVVEADVQEHGLLVAQVEVIFQFIVELHT